MADLPTEDDLKQLPLRAIVAYAARSARRVQPLYRLPGDEKDRLKHNAAIEIAVMFAERFCTTDPMNVFHCSDAFDAARAADDAGDADADADVAHSAADSAYGAADATVAASSSNGGYHFDGYSAADAASDAARFARSCGGNAVGLAVISDYEKLREMNSGKFPDMGILIDPTESGPLGPFWPDGPPDWYGPAKARMDAVLAESREAGLYDSSDGREEGDSDGEFVLEIGIPDDATDEEVIKRLKQLAQHMDGSHRLMGGHGVAIEVVDVRGHVHTEVPQ